MLSIWIFDCFNSDGLMRPSDQAPIEELAYSTDLKSVLKCVRVRIPVGAPKIKSILKLVDKLLILLYNIDIKIKSGALLLVR